ncbi:MAG: ribonuclease III, partial [Bacteroidetes bacterium]|nr:ribonuclease III [Bacteroidota bacterium]
EQSESNFKSQLIEWSQKNKKEIDFETTEESNDSFKQPKFRAVVKIDNKQIGKGTGTSKKEAHQEAAKEALKKLRDPLS